MFPQERDRIGGLYLNCGGILESAERILQRWVELRPWGQLDKQQIESEQAKRVAIAFGIQSTRLFRAVLEACTRSDAFVANINTRSQFETLLLLEFLLRPNIRVRVICERNSRKKLAPPTKQQSTHNSKDATTHELSRAMRCGMYIEFQELQETKLSQRSMNSQPSCDQTGAGRNKPFEEEASLTPKDWMTFRETEVWTQIVQIMKVSNNFTGMNVKTLVELLDDGGNKKYTQLYDSVYFWQSSFAHGNRMGGEMAEGINPDEDTYAPFFYSSNKEVVQVLIAAVCMFRLTVTCLKRHIGYGQVSTSVDGIELMCDEFIKNAGKLLARTT